MSIITPQQEDYIRSKIQEIMSRISVSVSAYWSFFKMNGRDSILQYLKDEPARSEDRANYVNDITQLQRFYQKSDAAYNIYERALTALKMATISSNQIVPRLIEMLNDSKTNISDCVIHGNSYVNVNVLTLELTGVLINATRLTFAS